MSDWAAGNTKLAQTAAGAYNSDWLGSDGGSTILLGGRRVLWVHGDSQVAVLSASRDRDNAFFVNNSMRLQVGAGLASATLTPQWQERNYEQSIDMLGLVGWWKLGTNFQDSSGLAHHATGSGTFTHSQASLLTDTTDRAAPNTGFLATDFGASARGAAADHDDFDCTTGVTVICWGFADADSSKNLLQKLNAYGLQTDFFGNPEFRIYKATVEKKATGSGHALGNSQRRQIAGTYDAVTGLVRVYRDGKLCGETTVAGGGNIDVSANEVEIGSWASAGNWDGRLSQVKLYKNRAMSPEEIRDDWKAGSQRVRELLPGMEDTTGVYYYWPGTGIVLGGRLFVFCGRVKSPLVDAGWSVFYTDDWKASDRVDGWRWTPCAMPTSHTSSTTPQPNIQAFQDGGYLYCYAWRSTVGWHLARWPIRSAVAADLSVPEWWDGSSGWTTTVGSAGPVLAEIFSAEGSVHRRPDGTWVMVHSKIVAGGDSLDRKAVYRTAPAMTGPFSSPIDLYTPSDMAVQGSGTWYAQKLHLEMRGATPGTRLLTWYRGDADITEDTALGWLKAASVGVGGRSGR